MVKKQIFKKDCCFGQCEECKIFRKSNTCVLQCPALFDANRLYNWKEYANRKQDKVKAKKLRELEKTSGDLPTFKRHFIEALDKYNPHYFVYKWLDITRKFDIQKLGKYELYIQTDFSAQVILESQDKLNSQGHGVCVLGCWVVLHSPREFQYRDPDTGKVIQHKYFECDHVRVVTPAMGVGKDQDWYMHCTTFDELIKHYQKKIQRLAKITLWTDGARTQYKVS